jgi:hypothetical protein
MAEGSTLSVPIPTCATPITGAHSKKNKKQQEYIKPETIPLSLYLISFDELYFIYSTALFN